MAHPVGPQSPLGMPLGALRWVLSQYEHWRTYDEPSLRLTQHCPPLCTGGCSARWSSVDSVSIAPFASPRHPSWTAVSRTYVGTADHYLVLLSLLQHSTIKKIGRRRYVRDCVYTTDLRPDHTHLGYTNTCVCAGRGGAGVNQILSGLNFCTYYLHGFQSTVFN